ncbi:hypothetical protein NFA_23340 [Nocardia farcinica IFM 10152]|uniref:Uncharacterized protein n=2 Tax=Nocardia farcinica TaxID=37329 RepID=Q5YXB0_NOCFA|nr:hypothetical protein NFA_23340 [Nocardia farcinica IFM 10152]
MPFAGGVRACRPRQDRLPRRALVNLPDMAIDEDSLPSVDTLDEVTEIARAHDSVFLRYSRGPAADARSGPSRDFEAEVELPGWSVTTVTPEPWWPRPDRDWVARRLCKYAELGAAHGRFPWLLIGRVVGRGPDHEPLVADMTPIARVSEAALAEAERVYGERFHVGRDSTSD